jgi:hypothetical protein
VYFPTWCLIMAHSSYFYNLVVKYIQFKHFNVNMVGLCRYMGAYSDSLSVCLVGIYSAQTAECGNRAAILDEMLLAGMRPWPKR